MRSTATLALLLLALCVPAPALAGTFTVPFGNGTPMAAAGWSVKADAGAICAFEGTGTVFLNAGTLAAHSGCFYLFNAPALAQIMAVNVTLSYAKATAATALCAYSFAAQPGDTLRRCSSGTFTNAVATSGAHWLELGMYNEGTTAIAFTTPRANNVVFAGGFVTLSDPTAPALWASGPTGVQSGPSAPLAWSVADGESGAPATSYAIDGGARVPLRGQACSWLCGTLANGSAALDLNALADGPHSVTVFAQSYADVVASYGPFPFSVDHTAPAAPQIHVLPDPDSAGAGWWGHAPVNVSVSTLTASDVVSSVLRIYGPSGALVFADPTEGALPGAGLPARVFPVNGAYEFEVVQCDIAGHCTVSARAGMRWDGAAPPAPADASAAPLGLLAARDGAHLAWPALAGAPGISGIAGAFVGIGRTPASARAQALAAAVWEAGVPGVSETAIPAASIHGEAQVCLAVRLLSGAGLGAGGAGVRCVAVDEIAPAVTLTGGATWSGGAQTVALAVSDAGGAEFSQVLLDGDAIAAPGNAVVVDAEGAHVLRVVARDSAGNETVVERALGVDATPPSIGSVSVDFLAREVRVDVADVLSGVARVEVRLAGTALETRLSPGGASAVARVPAGLELDGGSIAVRVLDASRPANARELAVSLPVRSLPVLKGLAAGRAVTGRVVADAPARVQIWAYPKGRVPHLVGTYATRPDGTFSIAVRPGRTTRYAVAVAESQHLRGLAERPAGVVRVTARIEAFRLQVRGDRLVVRARFAGRGEATRLHLLVHDVRGGRWVEACLERGLPGVRLERTGRVWGTCRIPAAARGRAWSYRLVLAGASSTWPWRTPSSASRSLLLPL